MNVKVALGARIKNLRRKLGYTQEHFAEAIGVAPRHVSRIENGINTPSIETLAKIADILQVDIKELFNFPYMESEKYLKDDIELILDKLNLEELKLVHKLLTEIFR